MFFTLYASEPSSLPEIDPCFLATCQTFLSSRIDNFKNSLGDIIPEELKKGLQKLDERFQKISTAQNKRAKLLKTEDYLEALIALSVQASLQR